MTKSVLINLNTGTVEEVCETEFYTRVFGHPPITKEQREAEHQAWLVKHREESRRELEELRDRLCKLASPELAAKFRADWAEQDAVDARRGQLTEVRGDPMRKTRRAA